MTPDGGSAGSRPGRYLASLAWPDVDRRSAGGAILAVPLGSTEQHGPHLPLSTDTDVAVALCDRVAAARDDILVGPALPYGASGEHQSFPGTVSIGHAALEVVLVELCRSATETVSGVVLVCGHGGNATSLASAVRQLNGEGRRVLGWMATTAGDAHAGRTETSLMLAVAPEAVDLPRAAAGAVAPLAELMPVLRSGGVRTASPNGVLGDPAGASATEGERLLDAMAARLLRSVDAWWPRSIMPPTSTPTSTCPSTSAGRHELEDAR